MEASEFYYRLAFFLLLMTVLFIGTIQAVVDAETARVVWFYAGISFGTIATYTCVLFSER